MKILNQKIPWVDPITNESLEIVGDNLISKSSSYLIFYGIPIADFLGPCKYSNDCNLSKTNEAKLPDPKDFFKNLEIAKKLGLEQMNQKLRINSVRTTYKIYFKIFMK